MRLEHARSLTSDHRRWEAQHRGTVVATGTRNICPAEIRAEPQLPIARLRGAGIVKSSSQSTVRLQLMNTSTPAPDQFRFHSALPHALVAIACGSVFAIRCVAADESAAKPPAATPTATASAATTAAAEAKPAHKLPAAFEEVAKMAESGVSAEVLLQFVETSATVARPTGPDIIAMKNRGVPDPVIVTMMHRGAQEASRPNPSRDSIAAPAIVRTLATDGQLDPESYEFFWYHHAYPRALQNSYEALSQYHPYTRPDAAVPFPTYGRQRIPWRTTGFSKDSFAPGQSRLPKVQSGRR
jgi:hypothetical protein